MNNWSWVAEEVRFEGSDEISTGNSSEQNQTSVQTLKTRVYEGKLQVTTDFIGNIEAARSWQTFDHHTKELKEGAVNLGIGVVFSILSLIVI